MSKPTLAEMSGEKQKSPRLPLNQIRFNGMTGRFLYTDILKGRIRDASGQERFIVKDLGTTISVIFLKSRRKLHAFRRGEKSLDSNEHNSKYDSVLLYGEREVIKGDSDTLRKQFPQLKTNQIMYAIFEGELVRLVIKGLALNPNTEGNLYDYMASFKENGADEHFYEYETILFPRTGQSDMGTYQYIGFQKGTKLHLDKMGDVEKFMTICYNFCKESDAYFSQGDVKAIQGNSSVDDGIDTIEYPDDEDEGIDPENIPF